MSAPIMLTHEHPKRSKIKTGAASVHFPKFVLHRSTHRHELRKVMLRKVMGTSKLIESSAALSI
jgi:hypothetical protein